ncbi:contractile injection system protein, VgrG/Pvc8 family [Mycobacterium sp.]|uniref:contractile injection system protein, VgrG/Pvc8 family n=1 Tax=Mycobacterium sp. TaxID=1785 RepID=UPI003F99D4A8
MSTYQVSFNGTPADQQFYDLVSHLEIEENADLPGAIALRVPVAVKDGQPTWIGDARIAPYANIAVVATPGGGNKQCIFDGYVLTQKVHMPTGLVGATVDVWGQDATVLMSLTETAKEWSGLSDVDVANQIFQNYGCAPADDNSAESAPSHTDDEHTLMQRGSDADFLRRLARRTGRWFRVICADTPGQRTGYFATPNLSADPAITIDVNDPTKSSVTALDFSWDAARPTSVAARQASLTDADPGGFSADTSDSGLKPLDAQDLQTFTGKTKTVILTAAADTAELPARARGLLREADWFAKCEGTADVAVLKQVLRVGAVVAVEGCGSLLSGSYLVWSVRHSITTQAHSMAFVLVRNAMGPTP